MVARGTESGTGSEGAGRQRAFVGLGSNLGDRTATLRTAVAALPDVVAVSPVYETEPVGGPDDQAPFLNLVVELATDLSPGSCSRSPTSWRRPRDGSGWSPTGPAPSTSTSSSSATSRSTSPT